MGFCENYDYYGPDWATSWPSGSGSGGSGPPPYAEDLTELWLPSDIEDDGVDITQWVGSVGGNVLTPAGLDNCRPTITTSSWGTPAIQMLDPVNSTDPGNINQASMTLPAPLAGLYLFIVMDHNSNGISLAGSELGGTDLQFYDILRPTIRWATASPNLITEMDNLWAGGEPLAGGTIMSDMQGAFGFSLDPNDYASSTGAFTTVGTTAFDSIPCRIVEVALYNRRLTTEEAAEVIAYYEAKYPREIAGDGYSNNVLAQFDYTGQTEGVDCFVNVVSGVYRTAISGKWPNPASKSLAQTSGTRQMEIVLAASNPLYNMDCVTGQDGEDSYYNAVAGGVSHAFHVVTFENTVDLTLSSATSFSQGPIVYRNADGSWRDDAGDTLFDGGTPPVSALPAGFHIVDYSIPEGSLFYPYRGGSPVSGDRPYFYELVFMSPDATADDINMVRQALATKYGVALA